MACIVLVQMHQFHSMARSTMIHVFHDAPTENSVMTTETLNKDREALIFLRAASNHAAPQE